MNDTVRDEKRAIRRRMRESLQFLTRAECEAAGQSIAARLVAAGAFAPGVGPDPTIACFASLWDEPDTSRIIDAACRTHTRVALPAMVPGDELPQLRLVTQADVEAGMGRWHRDAMGVPVPGGEVVANREVTLVLIPGRAFDSRGTRVGRGGGHFDRFLAELAPGCRRLGIAFDLQVVATLPREVHDLPVSAVVTPTRWITATALG